MALVTDKKIGVLMGGLSSEREVSLASGNAVLSALREKGYHPVAIDAGRDVAEKLHEEAVEIAFIALHGRFGEDGALQGLLEVMGIPYTGSGILASALAMDKEMSKLVFREYDLPIAPYRLFTKKEQAAITLPFGYPWVVKPVAEGSSIGVSIVRQDAELPAALEDAFR